MFPHSLSRLVLGLFALCCCWFSLVTHASPGPFVEPAMRWQQGGNPDNPLQPPLGWTLTDKKPALADLDSDGDMDLLLGSREGTLHWFSNIGTAAAPVYVELTGADNPLGGVQEAASTNPALADLDGDGDVDLLLGVADGSLHWFENQLDKSVSPSQPVFVERTGAENPLGEVNAGFNTPTLADLDKDGDVDLLLVSYAELRWFENTGTPSQPLFVERTGAANPLADIAVGSGSVAALADLNGDGDVDLLVGEYLGALRWFENTGTPSQPTFVEQTDTANPLAAITVGNGNAPALADLDGDGDLDMLVGATTGSLHWFKNTGSKTKPAFVELLGVDNLLEGVEVKADGDSAPGLADLDADGDLDLMLGRKDGTLSWFENVGSSTHPAFVERVGEDKPTFGVAVVSDSIPAAADLDADGDLDLIVGESIGFLHWFENIGSPSQPAFAERTQEDPLANIYVGRSSAPTLADLDSDGDLDLVLGSGSGTLRWFDNTGSPSRPTFVERSNADNPLHAVKVGLWSTPSLQDLDADGDFDVVVGADDGTLRWFENTGNSRKPVFVERTGADNPLAGVAVSKNSIPALADLNADGSLDVLVGARDGSLKWFNNASKPTPPSFVELLGAANPLSEIAEAIVESMSTAFTGYAAADLDGDGDLDRVVGTSLGQLGWLENIGSPSHPAFVGRGDADNPLAGITVGAESTPALADLDADGDLDLVVGENGGILHWFDNTGNANKPVFVERVGADNPLNIVYVGHSSVPTLADLDSDGDVDLVVGAGDGTLRWFTNTGSRSKPVFVERSGADNPLAAVKVADVDDFGYITPALADLDADGDVDLVAGAYNGKLRWFENQLGSGVTPNLAVFVERTDAANPLAGVTVNAYSIPLLADADADGDIDVAVGGSDGTLRWLENVTPAVKIAQASPVGGSYAVETLNVALGCGTCQNKIYYTLNGSTPTKSSNQYTKNLGLQGRAQLKFRIEDALGSLGSIFTENYLIENQVPQIHLEELVNDAPIAKLAKLSGTLSDKGLGIERLELQIFASPLYFQQHPTTPFNRNLTWNRVTSLLRTAHSAQESQYTWSYELDDNLFPLGKYDITIRAVDWAGNTAESRITIYKTSQAPAELSLESFRPTIVAGENLLFQGRLISRRYPALIEDLSTKPLELYVWPESCEQAPHHEHILRQLDDATAQAECALAANTPCTPGQALPTECQHQLRCQTEWVLPACTENPEYWNHAFPLNMNSDIGQFSLDTPVEGIPEGKYYLQFRFPGDALLAETVSSAYPILIGKSAGYALLVQGRAWLNGQFEGEAAHNKTLNRIYRLLLERGLRKDNIRYFNFNDRQDVDGNGLADDVYAAPNLDNLAQSLIEWLPQQMAGAPAPVYIVLVDHGDPNGEFYLDQNSSTHTSISSAQLNAGLTQFEANLSALNPTALEQPRVVIVGSCYSGNALNASSGLNADGRIIIASASANEESYKGPLEEDGVRSGEYFVENLFQALGNGSDFGTAFADAQNLTHDYTRSDSANSVGQIETHIRQNPQLNVNGIDQTAQPNVPLILGLGAELPTNATNTPADLCHVPAAVVLPNEGAINFDLSYRVNDARRVKSARLDVRKPSLQLPEAEQVAGQPAIQQDLPLFRLEAAALCSQTDHHCRHSIASSSAFLETRKDAQAMDAQNLFKDAGRYELQHFVTDSETDAPSMLHRSFVYKPQQAVCATAGQTACNAAPSAFQLRYPENQSLTTTAPLLIWYASQDTDGFTYTLSIAADKNLKEIVYQAQNLQKTYFSLASNALLQDCTQGLTDGKAYYWQVQAIDNLGAVQSSPIWQFKVDMSNARNAPLCPDNSACDIQLNGLQINGDNQVYVVKLFGVGGGFYQASEIMPSAGAVDAVFYPDTWQVAIEQGTYWVDGQSRELHNEVLLHEAPPDWNGGEHLFFRFQRVGESN